MDRRLSNVKCVKYDPFGNVNCEMMSTKEPVVVVVCVDLLLTNCFELTVGDGGAGDDEAGTMVGRSTFVYIKNAINKRTDILISPVEAITLQLGDTCKIYHCLLKELNIYKKK